MPTDITDKQPKSTQEDLVNQLKTENENLKKALRDKNIQFENLVSLYNTLVEKWLNNGIK